MPISNKCPSPPYSNATTTSCWTSTAASGSATNAIPGSPEALTQLRAAGKAVAFVTNDARRSPEDYVRKLWSLGLRASLEEVVTVGAAIQYELAGRLPGATAYVIGSPAIFRHVAESGHRIVNGTERATDCRRGGDRWPRRVRIR